MPTYKGRWVARVEQDFEVDAEDLDEAMDLLEDEMMPTNVVELLDIEVESITEVTQ